MLYDAIMTGEVVSIHAPARGATMAQGAASGLNSFQSTRPRGARRLFVAAAMPL